ncbi:MAG: TerB N-terminal domain-containing protein [Oscillospiraceae bacterium]|nr:TerB N-terminal domain-containing protein [Oscillospiraceae bacterium]
MDTNRMKKAAEWFYGNVFKDEAIRPQAARPAEKTPSLLRAARSLENSPERYWQARESIFLKQAKLLASYEDDYPLPGELVRYYPTYQSFTDQELRGYFSWRTKLRRGQLQKASLSFAFLYIYELINLAGVSDAAEGYQKLTQFRDDYGKIDPRILIYLESWLKDFVVYYGLDANLLADMPQVVYDRSITVLDHIQNQEPAKIIYAIKQLSPKWLERSKFYSQHREDMDRVIVSVFRRISDHYAARCKKTMVEQYFGKPAEFQVRLFETAVFCDPLKKRNCEYALDERCVYRCKNGLWTVRRHVPQRSSQKLGDLLKTIDAIMREEFRYGHPIKWEMDTKWIVKIIRDETQALLTEKRAAEAKKKAAEAKKITIDYSQLEKIRQDAAITREKLTVDEELEEETPEETPPVLPEPPADTGGDTPLAPAEYRLLQCLLYGRDYSWVHTEGYMLSVLSDSINDKLYDMFLDSVLDDTPELVEDYIDDLKEMVHP